MSLGLFNDDALERMSSPEDLNRLVRFTSPRDWLVGLALLAVVAASLAWAVFGRVSLEVPAQGLLLRDDGLRRVPAQHAGFVRRLPLRPGATLRAGDVLVELEGLDGASLNVSSPVAGLLAEYDVGEQSAVNADTVVARLELTDRPLQGLFFVPLMQSKKLQVGMAANLQPDTVPVEEFGNLLGRISFVNPLPASEDGLRVLLPQALVAQVARRMPVVQVVVELGRDPKTPSGFSWSTGAGPPWQLANATPCQAGFVLRSIPPARLLLPGPRLAP